MQEKVTEWTAKFGRTLGLSIKEVTGKKESPFPPSREVFHCWRQNSLFYFSAGDTDQEDLATIDTADIVCTTPEKFDAMTRRHRDRGGMRFFNQVRAL